MNVTNRAEKGDEKYGDIFLVSTRIDQMGDHMKMNFDYFQVQKMNVTNRAEKTTTPTIGKPIS